MKHTLFAVFVLLLTPLSAGAAQSFTVTDVAFDTLERLNSSELLVIVGVKVGDTYTSAELLHQIEKDITRLYATGKFEEVGPVARCRITDFSGGKRVVYHVKEKKLISAVYIKGATDIDDDKLTEDLATAKGRFVSSVDLKHDRNQLLEVCRNEGYLFAEVATEVLALPQARAEVTFVVSLGPYVRIYEIRFVGNKVATSSELQAQMVTKERDFWFFGLITQGYFTSEEFSKDIGKLRKYLRKAKGLLDANVGLQSVEFDPAREKMVVNIRVDEGDIYTLKGFSVNIESPSSEPHFSASELLAEVDAEDFIGRPYRSTELERIRAEIRTLYMEDGYLNCRVHLQEPKFELEGRSVTAVLSISEKRPVYARRIQIRGNRKTKDEVVRRALVFGPGDLVTSRKINKSVSNLHELQFFRPEKVNVRHVQTEEDPEDGTDFKVDVEEGFDGRFMVGVGLASEMGVIGSFALQKKNFDITDWPDSITDIPNSFTGAGQILSLRAQPGTRYSSYQVDFTEPFFMSRWYALRLFGYRSISYRDTWDEDHWGAGFRLSRYFTFERDISASLGYKYGFIDIGSIDGDAPPDAFEAEGSWRSSVLSIGFNINKYLYDPYAGPYEGFKFSADYEYSGGFLGADLDFSRAETGLATFFELFKDRYDNRYILTLTGNFGWMEPHHNTAEIPLFERFWLGGPRTVRGFRYYGVGPHENGEEIGGIARVYGNVEFTYPFFFNLLPIKFLRGVVFFDWGQLEGPYMKDGVQKWDFDRLAMDRMRTAAGVGLRISLNPLGLHVPISLYWGEALEKEDGDRPRQFLFNMGTIGF